MILGDVIERNERCSGDHPAVIFEGRTLSHREFARRVKCLVNALAARGHPRQARIAVLSRNCPEYLEVYGAAGLGGFVALGLNYRLSAPEQAAILLDAQPSVFFVEAEYLPRLRELRAGLPAETLFVCFDAAPGEGIVAYEDLLREARAEPLALRAQPDDTLFLIYTSGTTGVPKGVMLGNEGQLEQARVQSLSHLASPTDRMLIVMPFYHIGGPTELLTYTVVGATIVLHRQFDAHAILASIAEHRVTSAHLAPTMISMMLDVQEKTPCDLSSLHTICYASAPMSVALSIRARKVFGPIFMQIYGMTEAGLGTTLLKHQHVLEGDERQRKRLASAGQAYLGTELKILADDGSECPGGVVGEVCLRSRSVMQGYWRKPEATAQALADGVLHTGDMGYLDEDHYLFIVDRKKDMVISGGENIYSREVEEALLMHPAVAEVAVIGVPDPKWGESVAAMVVFKPGQQADEAALDKHCRELIAGYKRPKVYRFLEAMPRVPSTNKVDKRALRAPYWQDQQRQVS
ncbi:AMP-binding protein [Ramlibacter sp. AW1]|uniref:AMP-binding protein n=1 Tax=Ramlibacter aurantiacus TaxID=2801330 RepID=A0A936ZLA2_9BURK|nr:AMP-binding protein [Ramlibacter aurantiacus]MBL0419373.1 AMP-binding protein [Ramlibacter aurantiacus]